VWCAIKMAHDMLRDYRAWHDQYEDPDSPLTHRLRLVQRRLDGLLTAAAEGPIRLLSLCAGEGRDVLGVLPNHARRADVTAVLVELDPRNVRSARAASGAASLESVEVIEGDAALSDTYAGCGPADLLLACGIFGNVSDAHVREHCANAFDALPPGCLSDLDPAPAGARPQSSDSGAGSKRAVSWFSATKPQHTHRRPGVGTARRVGSGMTWRPGHRFFTFVR